ALLLTVGLLLSHMGCSEDEDGKGSPGSGGSAATGGFGGVAGANPFCEELFELCSEAERRSGLPITTECREIGQSGLLQCEIRYEGCKRDCEAALAGSAGAAGAGGA